jgi:RimJ/RimL family protein N-acetyltransferase
VHRANAPSVRLLEHFGYAPDPVQEQRHADLPELRCMRIYALERATWEHSAA